MADTLVNFGLGALILTFIVSLYGIGAAVLGYTRSRTACWRAPGMQCC